MLSLVVIARDEAPHIESCLASVPFATERIVVDGGSTDGTPELAERAGAVVHRTDWPGFVAQKNRAFALASQPWILSLDADERLSPEAAASLEAALRAPGEAAGFSFARLSTWGGRPLRHGRWYPDRKVRVARRGQGRWQGEDPPDHLVVDGPVRALAGDILHDPYRDLSDHLDTIDRYSSSWARNAWERGRRCHWWDPAVRPPLHFVNAYVLRRGFQDGMAGLTVAGLGATHVLLKWTRLWMLQTARDEDGRAWP